MKRKLSILIFCLFTLLGCEESNEDRVKSIETDGSVQIEVSIKHLNSVSDLSMLKKIYWLKGKQIKTVISKDTIPSLGKTKVVGEDEEGNDSTIVVDKNYQIFITVK